MSVEPQETSTQESAATNSTLQDLLANRVVLAVGAVAAIALVAVCILGILLLRASRDDDDVVENDGTPTPFLPDAEAEAVQREPLVVGMSDSATISVTLDTPVSLNVGNESFTVQTQVIGADGTWSPNIEDEDTAVWVYGSIVNYVVGIPDSEENRALLEQLAPGDEMVMATRGGARFTFSFNSRTTVPVSNRDVFAQNVPGITLVMLNSEGGERLVVNGRYIVSQEDSGPGNVVSLGETAQLENIQITVDSTTYLADRAEIPPGFAFFLIDYQIQNVGLTAMDTSNLQLLLTDNLGNQYALNPAASRLGNSPPLTGFLNANQVVQATAGYQIPLGLESDSLSWVVTNQNSGGQVYVTLPFTGGESAAAGTNITLVRVDVSSDLTNLILGGQVTNLGTQPVVVTESDVSLRGEDGATYLLLSTNPPFPWTVPPGQTVQFFLTYQRPPSATAVFTVLNQGFQLTGLR